MVMGDDDGGDAQFLLDALDLHLHLDAQLGIQVGQGLVQQQDMGPGHQRSCQGHPLLLAAGKLSGVALVQPGQLHQGQDLRHPLGNLRLFQLLQLQAKGHVLKHGHMGEQRIVLEKDADVPLIGRDLGHILPVHQDAALRGLSKAGDHPQGGGLAAAAAAQQGDHLSVSGLEIHIVNGGKIPEAFGKSDQFQCSHGFLLISQTCPAPRIYPSAGSAPGSLQSGRWRWPPGWGQRSVPYSS